MHKILIADDDPVILKLLEYNLSKSELNVVACTDGKSVLETAMREKPHLFLLDYLLPEKSGLELTQTLRETTEFKETPIIIITGQGKTSLRNEFLAAGANEVFTKPFSPKKLLSTIQQMLTSVTYEQHSTKI